MPPFAAKNVSKTPLVGGQWRLKDGNKYDIVITDNRTAPAIPVGGKMEADRAESASDALTWASGRSLRAVTAVTSRPRRAFGSVLAADDLDLASRRARRSASSGRTAPGKTTLFNLITGGLTPDAGRSARRPRSSPGVPPQGRCRAGIGRSYQIPQPFENLTVFENLLVGAVHGGASAKRDASQSAPRFSSGPV